MDIEFINKIPNEIESIDSEYNLIVDAIFGFSFSGNLITIESSLSFDFY